MKPAPVKFLAGNIMRPVQNILLIILFVLLPSGAVSATDEINMGSPYQKFDPETGYYSIISKTAPPKHKTAAAPPAGHDRSMAGTIRSLLASWVPSLAAGGVLVLLLGLNFVKQKSQRVTGEEYPR